MKMSIGSAIFVIVFLGLAAKHGIQAAPFQGLHGNSNTMDWLRNFFREINLENEVSSELYGIHAVCTHMIFVFLLSHFFSQVAQKESESAILLDDVERVEINYEDGEYFESDLAISSQLIQAFYGGQANVRTCL